jgi:endo-1,4-beta-xylanase
MFEFRPHRYRADQYQGESLKSKLWPVTGAGMLFAGLVSTALASTPPIPGDSLQAQFSARPIVVDALVDEAWSNAAPASITHAYEPQLQSRSADCPAMGTVRAMWDGALLYLLISVSDPQRDSAVRDPNQRDGVEFWVDHFNDKAAKFQEDDGTFTITAPPTAFVANRPQNTLYDNVTSRYLKAYASAATATGYNVEIAWQIGEHARVNGTRLGFDFAINDSNTHGRRQWRVFWNSPAGGRSVNDSTGWGTVVLAGHAGEPLPLDTFLLTRNLAKAIGRTPGIWRDESDIHQAIRAATAALQSQDQATVDAANAGLDAALRGLRRSGPYPDPLDLPEVRHLHDPFEFRDGQRVRTRADWNRRREEIKSLMQYYEFGVMPAKPQTLTATSITNGEARNITIRMSDKGRNASFAARLSLPTAEQAAAAGKSAPFPVIVSLDFTLSDGDPNYLAAGYAVLSIPAREVRSDNVANTGPIFDLYPYDVAKGTDFGSLLGWAWGASRAVDALEYLVVNDPNYSVKLAGRSTPLVALNKLAVTGFSRMGKGALLTGMLDERFAVTHAGASGSGGAAPYRFVPFGTFYSWGFTRGSETLGDHMRHQTHNSNEMMRRFLNDTVPMGLQPRMYLTQSRGYGERLPFDHHLEIAAIAPRAVLIANTNDDYGNNAEGDAIGVLAARPVFEFLGAGDKLALDIHMGGGGHSIKLPQRHNFVRFLDYVLYGKPLPGSVPPGDSTETPTDVQLRRDPYATGGIDANGKPGASVYDIYYGGVSQMMPWLDQAPGTRTTP